LDRRRIEISLGLLVLVSLGILAYIALKIGDLKGFGSMARANVVFDDVAGLVEGASVRVAGVQVGRVEALQVDFDKARATLLLDEQAGIRQDAQAAIRARSLLGEKYVEILPRSRTAPLVTDGMELQAVPTQIELDQVIGRAGPLIDQLDLKTVGPLLDELYGVVHDNRTAVGSTLQQINTLLARVEKLEFDDPALQTDLKTMVGNLRRASDRLPELLDEAGETLESVSARAVPLLERLDQTVGRLEPTLEQLPETVTRLNATLEGIDRTLARIDPLLVRAQNVDYNLFRHLLREEGLLVRFRPQEVDLEPRVSTPSDQEKGEPSRCLERAPAACPSSPAAPQPERKEAGPTSSVNAPEGGRIR